MKRFIKLECPACGRKSQGYRADYDPPEATLLIVRCPDCSVGCKEGGGTYFDKRGEEVPYSRIEAEL